MMLIKNRNFESLLLSIMMLITADVKSVFLPNECQAGLWCITLCDRIKPKSEPSKATYGFWIIFDRWIRIRGPKKHSMSRFRNIRGFPANSAVFAVFAILNIRNQVRSILFFELARHHHCGDFAKRKSRKCWKIKIWWWFKVQKFQFSDNFFDFFGTK